MRRAPSHRIRAGSAAALVAALALPAGAAEPRTLLRVAAHWAQPSDDTGHAGGTLEVEYAVGLAAALEVLVRPRLGVELAYASLHHDLLEMSDDGGRDVGGLRVAPLTLMVNFHSQVGTRANLFLGAGLAYTEFGELELRWPEGTARKLRVEEDLTLAAQVALDLPIGDRWGLTFGRRYLEAKAKTAELVLPVKPWIGWVGVQAQF
jgi:outer membrane protein W